MDTFTVKCPIAMESIDVRSKKQETLMNNYSRLTFIFDNSL